MSSENILRRKLNTQPDSKQSLPKLRPFPLKTLRRQPKSTNQIIYCRQFPQTSVNPEIMLRKISVNLNLAKRISTQKTDRNRLKMSKILPHHVSTQKSLMKLTGLKSEKYKVLSDDNIVHMTAQKWLIYDCIKRQVVKGFKYKKPHDVASLSKILTFYTAFMIIKQYNLSISKIQFMVMKEDQQLGGSKIQLKDQNLISLQDTIYAMLMDSANNAASVLANNLGLLCLKKRQDKYFSCFDINQSNRKANIDFFMSLMRTFAKKLQLFDTTVLNPHGMSGNISTARDISNLFQTCWKIPLFRKIMQTKKRQMQLKFVDNQGILSIRNISLKNTNTMDSYNKFCIAGKTGENKNGGNSFIGYFQDNILDKKCLIVVLGSFGKQQKFRDTDKLYEWLNSGEE